jgi:hypothetical protein
VFIEKLGGWILVTLGWGGRHRLKTARSQNLWYCMAPHEVNTIQGVWSDLVMLGYALGYQIRVRF